METATLNRPKNRQRQIVLNVPSQKYNLMMEALQKFDFVKVVEEDEGDSREDIIANLKEAAQSLKLIKEGKHIGCPAEDLLNEL